MKSIYYLRIIFISFEMLVFLSGVFLYFSFEPELKEAFESLSINEDARKWLLMLPLGIVGWTFKEGKVVIFPNEKLDKFLHEWPDYWKLKCHFNIGILIAVVFSIVCIYVWLIDGLEQFKLAWLFLISTLVILINACSFYMAIISIKSMLLKVK
ncbi:hypothetical protein [Ferrimonas marina]|uniref:DUF5671 domain-containing protein n=1 Tax=Ferrimonas marina TaxID=299255 RepID=A0A1M5R5Q0_9GAMM|nr:hypothetical protein [Ferrimonas marina]SHH21133.1 hypothetical protein SAMN02745129_1478 [Ferrimonas marina]